MIKIIIVDIPDEFDVKKDIFTLDNWVEKIYPLFVFRKDQTKDQRKEFVLNSIKERYTTKTLDPFYREMERTVALLKHNGGLGEFAPIRRTYPGPAYLNCLIEKYVLCTYELESEEVKHGVFMINLNSKKYTKVIPLMLRYVIKKFPDTKEIINKELIILKLKEC